jgi:quercetin dioxygenase-like cupin family protein
MKPFLRNFIASSAVVLGLAACTTPPAPTAAETLTAKSPLVSGVYDIDALPVEATAFGSRRSVFNAPTTTLTNFECHISTIKPGQTVHPPHTHGNEEMLIVKDGTLAVFIKGRTYTAGPGAIIFYASNDLHGASNAGATSATYYVFSWATDKTPATIPPPGGEPKTK